MGTRDSLDAVELRKINSLIGNRTQDLQHLDRHYTDSHTGFNQIYCKTILTYIEISLWDKLGTLKGEAGILIRTLWKLF